MKSSTADSPAQPVSHPFTLSPISTPRPYARSKCNRVKNHQIPLFGSHYQSRAFQWIGLPRWPNQWAGWRQSSPSFPPSCVFILYQWPLRTLQLCCPLPIYWISSCKLDPIRSQTIHAVFREQAHLPPLQSSHFYLYITIKALAGTRSSSSMGAV